MEKKKVFRSRISVLLIGIMLITFIPIFIIAIPPLIQFEDYKMLWIFALIMLPIIPIFTGIHYTILEGKLFIKILGIPLGNIDIADIAVVKRSYNIFSSPAASLKRLKISSEAGMLCLISPVREQEFIEALKAINPDIYVDVSDKKGAWCIQDWDI
jgi:hypothetical protein